MDAPDCVGGAASPTASTGRPDSVNHKVGRPDADQCKPRQVFRRPVTAAPLAALRATRAARHPHALVVRTAVEVTAQSVFEEEGVEVQQ